MSILILTDELRQSKTISFINVIPYSIAVYRRTLGPAFTLNELYISTFFVIKASEHTINAINELN